MDQRDDPSSGSLQNTLVTTVILPVSVILVVFATAFVGKAVCRTGNGFCADNILPGPILAGGLFTLAHLASSLAYRSRRWRTSILIGVVAGAAVTSLAIYLVPERGNVITALAVGGFWICLFAVECLVKVGLWKRSTRTGEQGTPPSRTRPADTSTTDRLVEVFRGYHAFAARHSVDLDASGLLDEGALPFPKDEILDVLCVYLSAQEEGRDRESVTALALDLASFQRGVGPVAMFPKEEGLRRLSTGPMSATVFTTSYDRMEAEAERYAAFQPRVAADLRAISKRCAEARSGTRGSTR
jgi:hypothetical protein